MPFIQESERELVPQYNAILTSIDSWIKDRFNYVKQVAVFAASINHIITHRTKVDLYLRFFDKVHGKANPTIVIARIGFIQTRKGHGTDFLKLVTGIALKHGYEYIEIENCNDNSKAFANKFGFQFDLEECPSCCRVKVENLASHFCLQ